MTRTALGAIAVVAGYNLLLLAGCAYLVQCCGWNPWWFLVAICCLASFESEKDAGREVKP